MSKFFKLEGLSSKNMNYADALEILLPMKILKIKQNIVEESGIRNTPVEKLSLESSKEQEYTLWNSKYHAHNVEKSVLVDDFSENINVESYALQDGEECGVLGLNTVEHSLKKLQKKLFR